MFSQRKTGLRKDSADAASLRHQHGQSILSIVSRTFYLSLKGNCKMRLVAVCFDKCDYEAAEFLGFLEGHQMAGVFDYDAA